MIDFVYHNPTSIVFGRGAEKNTGEFAARYGKKILLHYGGGSIKRNGVYDKIVTSLREHGLDFVELGGVQPNPRLSMVYEGIALCKQEQVDLVLAVGGGSAIDSAKAIAAGVCYDGDVWDFFATPDGPDKIKRRLALGSVLTIPAAGSESSISCVITNEDGWYKRGVNTDVIRPDFAIINPETNYTLPPYQTACGCADIMAHLMERYFTQVRDVDYSDRLIEASLRTMLNFAPLALKDPDDYDIRAEINWVGTLAHNTLLDRGRISDWGSHMIEHEISGIYDIAHGAGLSIVFPAWMRYVNAHHKSRFVQFAVRVMDVDMSYDNEDRIIQEGIDRLERFFLSLGLPTRLGDADIGSDHLREMADKCKPCGNLVKLDCDDVYEILKLAL